MFLTYRFFFFNDTATTEIYTLSLHDALPISHHVRRLHDLQAAAVDVAVSLEGRLDVGRPPHELDQEAGWQLAQRLRDALPLDARGVVAPHGVQRDADHRSGVLDRHPLLAAVVAAGRAHPVRSLQVAAAGAGLQRDGSGLVVRAAGAFLPLGGSALRYRHDLVPFSRGACP